VDARNVSSRNGTDVGGWACNGGRNQQWWYDTQQRSLHSGLSHDRCVDVPGANYTAGTAVELWNCHGGGNQQFVRQNGTIRPAAAQGLCLTLGGATELVRLQACDGSARQQFA
jgi:hypothetical protein